jgi:crotonobetainyl-CoA:carnitine CoA-transferase CaiB-like acyl-CoA transferase
VSTVDGDRRGELPADTLPLSGTTVLDMSRFLAGPFSATLLGDLGADVIRIEAPDRDDPQYHTAPVKDGVSLYNLATSRNKRAIRIDLRKEEGYAVFAKLLERADAVVENYRRDVPERLRVDYDSLRRLKPSIVVCSVRSFAKESSLKDRPAYDAAVQAYTGLMSVTGSAEGGAARAGVAVADFSTGLYAALGVVAGLYRAAATGRGEHYEIALADTGLACMAFQLVTYMNTGEVITRSGTEHPATAPLRVFETATSPMLVMAAKDEEFVRLCRVLGRPEWIELAEYRSNAERARHRQRLHADIQAIMAGKPAAEWLDVLESARVPCTLVRSVDQIAADPDVCSTMVTNSRHAVLGEVRLVRNPLTLSGQALPITSVAPGWGQDSDQVLDSLGYSASDKESLRQIGAVV